MSPYEIMVPGGSVEHVSEEAGLVWLERVTQTYPNAVTADPSQASAVEGHRHRERSARYFAQLRPQGRNGWQGEVRGPHPGACREYPRLGGTGGAGSSSGGCSVNRSSSCTVAC